MKKRYYVLLALALAFCAVAILIAPQRYAECCLRGFLTWATCVLPSLFPFMIITLLFIKFGFSQKIAKPFEKVAKFFNLPPVALSCAIMSLASGYPAGSKMIKEYYDGKAITESDAQKLSVLCATAGPTFVIGSVGASVFGDAGVGLKIYLFHALSSVIIALIFAIKSKERAKNLLFLPQHSQNAFYDAFYGAVISVAVAGGFIAFFSCVAQIVQDYGLLFPVEFLLSPLLGNDCARAFAVGLVELTSGCKALATTNSPLAVPLCTFLVSMGGLSVLAQQVCYLRPCKVKIKSFLYVKVMQSALAFLLTLCFA